MVRSVLVIRSSSIHRPNIQGKDCMTELIESISTIPSIIISIIIYVVAANYVFSDARSRKNHSIGWPLLTVVLTPFLSFPLYFAYRNLKAGEVRAGGTVWNIIRNYTLSWTLFVIYFMCIVLIAFSSLDEGGPFILASTGIIWLGVTFFMLLFCLIMKQSNVIERGPSGPSNAPE